MIGVSAGTYDVTVTDANGCTTTASVTVTEPTALSASAVASNVSCNGGSNGTVDLTVTGGTAPYTYAWSNTATTQDMIGLSAGIYNVTVTDANGCTATVSVTVTEPTALSASAVASNASCNGAANGTVDLSVTGGTAPYTYAWSNSVTTEDMIGLSAGTYNVTVTDANGCTATASVTVTEPTALSASAVASNAACNGAANGSVDLTVTGGSSPYTYAWSNSATTEDVSGLSADTYNVTITDAHGCTTTASATVTQPTAINITTSTTGASSNGGSDGTTTATVSGGVAPYTYSWTPSGGSNATATGLSAGSYTVTVTDSNGCTATKTVEVKEPAALVVTASVDANVSCNGISNGAATATVTGGTPPYQYLWSTGAPVASMTGVPAGTYTIYITDENGVKANTTVTISEPTALSASVTAGNVSCNGGSDGSVDLTVTGGTPPYTYDWSNSATTEDLSGISAGNYDVTVTDAHGCSTTGAITITEPTALSASVTAGNVSCNGVSDGSVDLTVAGGTPPHTYAWSNSATTEDLSGLSAGNYDVTVTDAHGCTTTESITITEPTALAASVAAGNVSCNGVSDGSVDLTVTGGTPPYTYAWSNLATTEDLSGLSAGNYDVTVTDAHGCTTSESITIIEPTALSASINKTDVNCNGGNDGSATVTASGGTAPYDYSWAPSGGDQATASGLSAGTYTVTITDAHGCSLDKSVTITEPTALSATTSTTDVTSHGKTNGSATVSVSGGSAPYTYSWTLFGGTDATATGLSAGTYTVTITDAHDCSISKDIEVKEPTPITVTTKVDSNISCNGGSDGTASASISGGNPPYKILWSNGTEATSISGVPAGTYTVHVTDDNGNGSTVDASVTISEPAALTATTHQTNVSCYGKSDGTAKVTASGGTAPYSYSWSASAGNQATATGLAFGSYTVTITDDHGCTLEKSVTISEPEKFEVDTHGDVIACETYVLPGLSSGEYFTQTDGNGEKLFEGDEIASSQEVFIYGESPEGCPDQSSFHVTINENDLDQVKFEDAGFTYDGNPHKLLVTDLPDGAHVSYNVANEYTSAGVFKITATVKSAHDSCGEKTLTASLTIHKAKAIITAEPNQNFIFDGNSKEVTAQLSHQEAKLNYSPSKSYTVVGDYEIQVSAPETMNFMATSETIHLVIEPAKITGINLQDAQFTYDGQLHSIFVDNLPEGVSVTYSNNDKINAGSYMVTATLHKENYEDKSLTANLVINKADQDITFGEIPEKNLETDPDFNLNGVASSGLPVTYTSEASDPIATITPHGFVELQGVGEILVTAHQEGNQNYNPAEPITQTLRIHSNKAELQKISFNGDIIEQPQSEIYYLMECANASNEVSIVLDPSPMANADTGKEFTIATPKPGIYSKTVTITSQDGTNNETYNIQVEKQFNFDDLIIQKFNNVLLVNNNPGTNGGYTFTSYTWLKNGQNIGSGQYYSAGDNSNDLLAPSSTYQVVLITEDGQELRTCPTTIENISSRRAMLAPSPVRAGDNIQVMADYSEEELQSLQISIHDLNGVLLKKMRSNQRITTLQIPADIQQGVYILICKTKDHKEIIKFIVQ